MATRTRTVAASPRPAMGGRGRQHTTSGTHGMELVHTSFGRSKRSAAALSRAEGGDGDETRTDAPEDKDAKKVSQLHRRRPHTISRRATCTCTASTRRRQTATMDSRFALPPRALASATTQPPSHRPTAVDLAQHARCRRRRTIRSCGGPSAALASDHAPRRRQPPLFDGSDVPLARQRVQSVLDGALDALRVVEVGHPVGPGVCARNANRSNDRSRQQRVRVRPLAKTRWCARRSGAACTHQPPEAK